MQDFVKFKYLGLLAAVIFAGVILFFYQNADSAMPPQKETLTINVIPLKQQDVEVTNQYVGYVEAIKSVELVPNVSGYIDEVWAEGGQEVKAGDNLIMIDQREYKAQLDAAKSAVAQAKADFNNARTYYNRMKKAGKKAISASALDEAMAKFLAAEAALKQAQAEEQKATVLYDYTVLQSPIDGIIGHFSLTKGKYVAPGASSLLSIIQFDPMRVMFAISDKEYLNEVQKHPDGRLFDGEEIKIRLSNGRLYDKVGQFQFTDNKIDKATNSISIYADFANSGKELMENSYVDVLLSKRFKDVFLIRQNYATLKNDGAFVYIMQNNKLKQVPLKIAGYYDAYYVTENKFAKDEYLVTDKIGQIGDGTILKMKINQPAAEAK